MVYILFVPRFRMKIFTPHSKALPVFILPHTLLSLLFDNLSTFGPDVKPAFSCRLALCESYVIIIALRVKSQPISNDAAVASLSERNFTHEKFRELIRGLPN